MRGRAANAARNGRFSSIFEDKDAGSRDLRLSQGSTLQQTADEFTVHLNSVEQWRQSWNRLGPAGLYEDVILVGRKNGHPSSKLWANWRNRSAAQSLLC
ncbi:helix-turn-helix domain-containing protein [Massilia sp.]|uniref:helix-turn-helix domain-containing protein n=1 Tax=Massilia sp. TaxID=1882437 RepID=UPI0039183B1E